MSMLFWEPETQRVIYLRKDYPHECFSPFCGNSGVILLSVKDHQHIDSAIPGRYTVQNLYKAGAGIWRPEID